MNKTKIEWTDFTWNPVTGCKHGCTYCYAKKITERFRQNFPNGFEPMFHGDRIIEPYHLRPASKIFTVSMGDLFGSWVPYSWQKEVFKAIDDNPRHTFQILTKDPYNASKALLQFFTRIPDNLWIGTSVDRAHVKARIKWLPERSYGGIRFVSFEPLLEDIGAVDLSGIDWIIIGAQTNPTVRPDPKWVQSLIDQAWYAGAEVFLKDSIQSWWPKEIRDYPQTSSDLRNSEETNCQPFICNGIEK